MKIACVGYRDWAIKIYENLVVYYGPNHEITILKGKEAFSEDIILDIDPDMILFYGWSWKVKSSILEKYNCLMLHPSPLPKYRGGSPIQNQIINGETKSAVSIIQMTDILDAGDILIQEKISLDGTIADILKRITRIGTRLTKRILANSFIRRKQNHNEATFYKRRSAGSNEITICELLTKDSSYLYNKVRMLGNPYPCAYIKTADGKKLLIKEVEVASDDD